uniref:Transcriptional regulator, ArsR family n=1 Tax=Candidatus Kentrum sp. MB TaxID=2138164 RepID=A0A450XW24_9GAMM|nr:MAG: transcriptional regulator, ArsR family [Candidatus Kentron sp. MB]VFK33501.1 MAG: transcriptional regulator, ArsR family [Candidatus Kentron sp. MB]VFK76241.1 MAG: transcriptional regulator, ArsR family [Candidatus Kentron sp. MB]
MNTPLQYETLDPPASDEYSTLTARALKAMAHPLRWRILCTLGNNELSVGEIVEKTGTSQSNVSQHLEQLRNKNIVTARKEANRVYYRIRNDQLLMLIGTMRKVLCPANLDTRESSVRRENSFP